MRSPKNAAVSLLALTVGIGAAGLAINGADAATPRDIGTVAAANNDILGTPPAQDPRQLKLGLKIVESERVETSPVGAGQFLFLDQTSLTVWPESDIVLDKYVFDPDKGAGDMAITATRGVLRFIGGRISKKTDVKIRTPHATVAIRGGMAQIWIEAGKTKVTNIASEYVKIITEEGEVSLSRPMAQGESEGGDKAPKFLGVGGPAEAAELYGQPLGVGNGGVQVPVTKEVIDLASTGTGIEKEGSGDPSAPRDKPISTGGEKPPENQQQNDDTAIQSPSTDEDARIDFIETEPEGDPTVGNENPPPNDPPIVNENPPPPDPPIVNENPPPAEPPPLPELPGTVLAGFSGGTVTALGVDDGDLFGQGDAFGQFVEVTESVDDQGQTIISAVTADGEVVTFIVNEGIQVTPDGAELNGQPADLVSIVDPDVFLLSAISNGEDVRLGFVGTPTPRDVWSAEPGADIQVRRYQVSDDLFSQQAAALPDRLGEPFGGGSLGELLLISDPAGPITPGFDAGGADADTSSKWALGWLAIEGEGAEQKAVFGAMTALVLPTETGAPSASENLIFLSRLGASEAPAFGDLAFGTLDDGAGATAFGPNGEHLILSNGGPYAADDDPAFDAAPGVFSEWTGDAEVVETFGDNRHARLDAVDTITDAARATIATPFAASGLPGVPSTPLESALTGGFAIAGGQGFKPAAAPEDRLTAPYLLATGSPDSVRFGFAPGENGVVAEIAGLTPVGDGADAGVVNLNFGGLDTQSAFASEDLFLAQDALGETGGVTGQTQSFTDKAGAPATDGRQNAFRGALAVSGAVGDGGIFPASVNANPEFLKWGWWAGEYRQDPNDADPDFQGRTDRLFPGVWVAGVQSDIASVRAASGQASFSGFAVANVIETSAAGVSTFVDGGSFDMTYNFSGRVGIVQINGIGESGLSSIVREATAPAGHHFGGALFIENDAGGAGSVRGAFFTGGGDATAATAGAFDFSANPVDGVARDISGVFGADRQ